MDFVAAEDGLTLESLAVMYQLAREIADGEYPMDSTWAEEWIAALPTGLRRKLDAL